MKSFKTQLAAVAMASALGFAGSANATLVDWYLNSNGTGAATATQVHDYVDLTGVSYVHNTFDSPAATSFTFNESGLFNAFSVDQSSVLSPFLSATFVGSGSGNTASGALNFNSGGILTIKAGALTIGTFSLQSGSANLTAGTVLPNGAISFIFEATSLAAGYFFDSVQNDLSALLADSVVTLGFATTNAIPLASTPRAGNLINLYNDNFNPDSSATVSDGRNDLFFSNNGQFRLDIRGTPRELPEPASLMLLGAGLLGLVGVRRRK